jgi:isocitrate/isopropylmalate dehydrogenase
VNPSALVLSGALLLDHLGEHAAAARVRAAVAAAVAGPVRTYDLGGTASTTEMTDAIIAALPGAGEGSAA